MGQYGRAALAAHAHFVVELSVCDSLTPDQLARALRGAWDKAVGCECGTESTQDKDCPKSAFLGLCSCGAIKDIPRADYTKSKKNNHYACEAVALLKRTPSFPKDELALWAAVTLGVKHNGQMDVVLALWEKNLIR